MSNAIVRKSELLARWSFDDGNGTIANEALGTGVDAILKEGATWGLAENAMSQGSLDISSGNGYALVASHPNLQSRDRLSPHPFGSKVTGRWLIMLKFYPRMEILICLTSLRSSKVQHKFPHSIVFLVIMRTTV